MSQIYVRYVNVRNIKVMHCFVNLVIMLKKLKNMTISRQKKMTSVYFDELLNQALELSLLYHTGAKSRVVSLLISQGKIIDYSAKSYLSLIQQMSVVYVFGYIVKPLQTIYQA